MKNEERVVELLAESLRNQDIQSEQLVLLTKKVSIATDNLNTVTGKLDLLVDVVKDLTTVVKSQTSTTRLLLWRG
jgi:hypothetical protein